jgi:type IV pilus modification protein PilV
MALLYTPSVPVSGGRNVGKGNLPDKPYSAVLCRQKICSQMVCTQMAPNQKGATLMEVLATAIILSLGVTSVLQLHSFGLLLTHAASQRQSAFLLVMDLSERVRIAPDEFRKLDEFSLNSTSVSTGVCSMQVPCSAEHYARRQLVNWRLNAEARLAGAEVTINREQQQLTVVWQVTIDWLADADEPVIARIGL